MKQKKNHYRVIGMMAILGVLLTGCHTLSDKEYVEVKKTPKQIEILERNDFHLQQNVDNLGKAVDQMRQDLQKHIHNNDAKVESISSDSAKVTLQNTILFGDGSTNLSRKGQRVLAKFAATLKKDEQVRVRIVGHTDSLSPSARLRKRYLDNWELSAVRAASVARYLVWVQHINPKRLSIVGRADTQALASNNTAKGRKLNRRVELFLEM